MKNFLRALSLPVFQITMPLFLLLGAVIVITQIVCCFTGNGSMSLWIRNLLRPWATYSAGVCLFAAFIYSYVKK